MSNEERKHTKGPWTLTRDPNHSKDVVNIQVNDFILFRVVYLGYYHQDRDKYFELIASAPTLLESNERMKELLQKALLQLKKFGNVCSANDWGLEYTDTVNLITAIEQEIKP